jgi:ferritin-like protein
VGELGRQIVRLDRAALLDELTRAYADEWFALYNFHFAAVTLRGHRSPSVVDFLRGRSTEAFARATRLAARRAELGGGPPAKLSELVVRSTDKPFKLPVSLADVDGVLRAVLDPERTSLRIYDGCLSGRGRTMRLLPPSRRSSSPRRCATRRRSSV